MATQGTSCEPGARKNEYLLRERQPASKRRIFDAKERAPREHFTQRCLAGLSCAAPAALSKEQFQALTLPAKRRAGTRLFPPGLTTGVGLCRASPPMSGVNRRWCTENGHVPLDQVGLCYRVAANPKEEWTAETEADGMDVGKG